MDEILVANFMVFQEVVEEGHYDLVIGDEAWDVDYYWHENPELKRGQNVWLTDFVGYLPMPDGGEREAFLTADYNGEMIEHIDRYPWIRDQAIFVGDVKDIVPDTFGANLPAIRDWTTRHFSYSGYITGFTPPEPDEVAPLRSQLGYRDDELVCVVAVGGSGVGQALIDKVVAAYPLAKKALPELRMIVVTGPRIDPAAFPRRTGLELRGYVHRLYQHLCVCDLAIVQGGLTTTMELTAAKRPFLYFPLGHTSSRTSTSATGSTDMAPANTWTMPPPTPTSLPPTAPNWRASPSATATLRPTARPALPSSSPNSSSRYRAARQAGQP